MENARKWAKKESDETLLGWNKKWWMTTAKARKNWSKLAKEMLLAATWELEDRKLA